MPEWWFLGHTMVEYNLLKGQAKYERIAMEATGKKISESIQEQNEYIVEIENFQEELKFLEEDYANEMEKLENKYWQLNEKALVGTITEEEQKELENIKTEMNTLSNETTNGSKELNNQIAKSKQNYSFSSFHLDFANSTLNNVAKTIDGLNNWNSDNSIENGGGEICQRYIKSNEVVISDLSAKSSELRDNINTYSSQLNFIKY